MHLDRYLNVNSPLPTYSSALGSVQNAMSGSLYTPKSIKQDPFSGRIVVDIIIML